MTAAKFTRTFLCFVAAALFGVGFGLIAVAPNSPGKIGALCVVGFVPLIASFAKRDLR
jgi:hypothetical protein